MNLDYPTDFKSVCYWFLSHDPEASFFRCRREVPLFMVDNLTLQEKEYIRNRVCEELEQGLFYEVYVELLVYWHDKEAIPLLAKCLDQFKEKGRHPMHDFSEYIVLLKKAIATLKETEESPSYRQNGEKG